MKYLLTDEETTRLRFKNVDRADYGDWFPFFTNPQTNLYWNDERIDAQVECTKWYDKQQWRYENNMGGMNTLIEKQSNKLIGHCGLLVQLVDDITELEIGYSLLPEFWKQGFATEAAQKCCDFAFRNNFAESLISIISLKNIPSQKVAERNGMKIEKRTRYHNNDAFIYRLTKEEFNKTLNL